MKETLNILIGSVFFGLIIFVSFSVGSDRIDSFYEKQVVESSKYSVKKALEIAKRSRIDNSFNPRYVKLMITSSLREKPVFKKSHLPEYNPQVIYLKIDKQKDYLVVCSRAYEDKIACLDNKGRKFETVFNKE